MLPLAAVAEGFTPGTSYYYADFEPGKQQRGQALNFEEVFKNYQYYELVVGQDGREITVNQFIRGDKTGSEKYLLLPDGSLQKK
ncbi:MAG: hypothetical protein Q7S94_10860 [Gallionella sp.]|nr:hypothetical protein [Gallionella sp.]